jgi:hypothetical protein
VAKDYNVSKMSISKLLRPESVLNLKLFVEGYDTKTRKRCVANSMASFTKHPLQKQAPATSLAEAVNHDTIDSKTEVPCTDEVGIEAMDDVLESLPDSAWLRASAQEATQDLGQPSAAGSSNLSLGLIGFLES